MNLRQPHPVPDQEDDPSDRVVLVRKDNPEKLFFDKESISKLKGGESESSSLIITKPGELQGKALGFYKSSHVNFNEIVIMALAVTSTSESQEGIISPTSWKYDDSTWISTTFQESNGDKKMYEYVLDVEEWKLEDMTPLWILRGKDTSKTRLVPDDPREKNGRAFVFNDDCSISPRGQRDLFLGRMGAGNGDAIAKIRNLIILNASVDTVKESLIDKKKEFINEIHDNTTFLCVACGFGRYDIAKLLLESGACVDPDVDSRPMNEACSQGRKEIVDLLLRKNADINSKNGDGTSPLAAATLFGHVEIAKKLLDHGDCNIHGGNNPSLSCSILNNHVECVKFLLAKGSSLDVVLHDKDHKICPLQQACIKNPVDSLPIVIAILKKRGDLDIKRIKKISGRYGTKAMEHLITAYASLEPMTLSLCIARAFAKYNKDAHADQIDKNNPFKACIDLAQEARQRWSKVRKSDPSTADKMLTLYTNLQLGAVAILEKLHTNTMEESYHGVQRISSSADENLRNFLNTKSSVKALSTALDIQSRTFFSQPLLFNTIRRYWYTDLLHEVIVEPHPSMWLFMTQWMVFLIAFLLQLPLFPIALACPQVIPRKFIEFDLRSLEYSDQEKTEEKTLLQKSRLFNTKKPMVVFAPVILFMTQCVADIALAIIFTILSADDLWEMEHIYIISLLLVMCSNLAWEIRDIVQKGVRIYILVDPFNRFDLPGLSLAVICLLIPLFPSLNLGSNVLRRLLACSTIFLWLRILRTLTLVPVTGPIALMTVKMITKVLIWLLPLIIFSVAFSSGVSKLELSGEISHSTDQCSRTKRFMPWIFFEDAISGETLLFDCVHVADTGDEGSRWTLSIEKIIVYIAFILSHVLLINMLIALMGESFNSVWDAQEANWTYQRATHYLEVKGKRNPEPIQCLYLPTAIFDVVSFVWEKLHSSNNHDDINTESVEVKVYAFDKKLEEELTAEFYEYIHENQNELVSEDSRWRFSLNKRVSTLDTKMSTLEAKMEKIHSEISGCSKLMRKLIKENDNDERESI